MKIEVNGRQQDCAEGASLGELLTQLGLAERRVAVERNGELVPGSQRDTVQIEAGDRIEIVHAIGGG